MTLIDEISELVQGYSTMEISCNLGLLVGILYHVTCQHSRQADVLNCLCFIGAGNVILLGAVFLPDERSPWLGICLGLIIFNIIFATLALVLKVVYNAYFRHRGIPTEFALSATDFRLWKFCQDGTSHLKIAQLHKKLGDIIRIQPNHISFNSLKALEEIHGLHSPARKGAFYKHILRPPKFPENLINASDKARHSFLRRVIGPSFHNASLNKFEPTLKRYCYELINAVERIGAITDNVVDMNDLFSRFSFDVAGEISFGQHFGALEGGEQHFVIKAFAKSVTLIKRFMYIPWAAKFLLLLPPPKLLREGRHETLKFAQEAIQKQKNCPVKDDGKTMVGNMLKAVDPEMGGKLSDVDILSNANILIVAASDTTATTLMFILYHLVAQRKYWDRLSTEIRSRFKSSDEITNASTTSIPFLDAVIHEVLRLRIPTPSNLQREVPKEGMMIDGHFITGGTTVSTPMYTLTHDERYFSNPEFFIPERWIESERGQETCTKAAWIPFSYGPRTCLGKPYVPIIDKSEASLALMELRMMISMFVWHFDVEFIEEGQSEPLYEDAFVAMRGPLPLRVSPAHRK